jgi:hypothetical protein
MMIIYPSFLKLLFLRLEENSSVVSSVFALKPSRRIRTWLIIPEIGRLMIQNKELAPPYQWF